MARRDKSAKGGRAGKAPRRGPAAGVALLLALLGAGWVAWNRPRHITPTDQELVAWAEARGAKLPGVVVGRACAACPRGVFASKNLQTGELLLSTPLKTLALAVDSQQQLSDQTAASYGSHMLLRQHTDPEFNATWGPYWASMPALHETFGAELFTDTQLEMLQHARTAAKARAHRDNAEKIYKNSTLASVLGEGVVPLDEFKRAAVLVMSRVFAPIPSENINSPYFLPLVQNGAYSVFAARPIKKGEEIFHNYGTKACHRPDGSLNFYGFVLPQDDPLLISDDLPAGYSPDAPDDSLYTNPASGYVTQAEHDRLAALLEAAPTTEAEDQALLDSGLYTDWRDQTILQFRIMRKRALRQAVQRLAAALQAGRGSKAEL